MAKSFPILLATLVFGGCNGSVAGNAASDAGVGHEWCEIHLESMINTACPEKAPPEQLDLVYRECNDTADRAPAECRDALERMYQCYAQEKLECTFSELCVPLQREYALCVSGGSCSRVGGNSVLEGRFNPERASVFRGEDVCRCLHDPWQAGSPGDTCRTWEDCTPVCCSCADSPAHYTGAACDFSVSAGLESGTCPSPERVCELTSRQCL